MKTCRALVLGVLVLLAVSSGGCGTISDMTQGDGGQRIYGGVRHDAGMMQNSSSTSVALGIFDFPFSLVLDTGLLPVTLIIALFRIGR
ncbi:MAG: YceK/YidQ family lipoprotein [Planctomycetes bacterium]|nr:YceK/YidQ family lipoprotein [Planctomycetota bacterium]